jgi:hypothetical protein
MSSSFIHLIVTIVRLARPGASIPSVSGSLTRAGLHGKELTTKCRRIDKITVTYGLELAKNEALAST